MRLFLAIALLLLTGSGAWSQTATPPRYQVMFRAVTAWGDPVPIHVVSFADPLHRRDLAAQCDGPRCANVAEGAYSYSVLIDETGRKVEGSAVVYRPNQVITVDVGTPASEIEESEFLVVAGHVLHAADPQNVWIRLQQLYSDSSISVRVGRDGRFELRDVRPGNWMLLAFTEGKLSHFEPYTCRPGNVPAITINLKDRSSVMRARAQNVLLPAPAPAAH